MIDSPLDIPDLVLWLSAEAIEGAANGAALTGWQDLSAAANHTTGVNGTVTYEASSGSAGGPAVLFSPGTYFTLPNLLAGKSSGELMASVKAANVAQQQNSWKWGTATGDPTNHYPFSNGSVYEDFGRTVRTSFAPVDNLAVWHRYNLWSAPNDWAARVNENVRLTLTSNTVSWATAPQIGNVGAFATAALRYGCIVVYGRKLTTTERADLAAWLTANPSGGTIPAPPPPPPPPPDPEAEWVVNPARTDALVSWAVSSGRTDANGRAEPVQVTVVLAAALTECPTIGERFQLTVTEGATSVRFTGEVTDPQIDPKRGVYTVTAVGRLGRARRRLLNVGGWPKEQDGPRVARILAAAAPRVVGDIDPGTSDIIKPGDNATAGTLLDLVSDSTLGQVVERLDGTVDWHDADHRRGAVPVLELAASEILNTLLWAQYVGDVVNEAAVTYGPDSAAVTAVDPHSVDTYEAFPVTVTTALADELDAHSLGGLIVGRRSEPVWQLPQLVVDLWVHDPVSGDGVDAAKRAALLGLKFADRITVTGLPAGSPYAASVELYVEGMQESVYRLNGGLVWRLALSVSDPRLSGVSVRYKDAPAALTYAGVDPTLTYLDLAQIENPAELGA